MFEVLRNRMAYAMGIKISSFEDLERAELDSVDSVNISETSAKGTSYAGSRSSLDSSSSGSIEQYAKQKVLKILRSIKKLQKIQFDGNESKMSMLVFMDSIRDQHYKHVSMNLLESFMKTCLMIPKAYYLHYYMYFLYYALHYHNTRATIDIIDNRMKEEHQMHFTAIRAQLKYLQYIINESRIRKVST